MGKHPKKRVCAAPGKVKGVRGSSPCGLLFMVLSGIWGEEHPVYVIRETKMTHRKPLGTAGACILLLFSLFGCASNHTQGNHSRHIPGKSSISCLHVPDPSGPSASSVADSSPCNWEDIRKLVEDARSAWKAERPDEALDILDLAYARLAEISPKTPEEEGEKNGIRIELARLIQEIHASNQTSTKGLASRNPLPPHTRSGRGNQAISRSGTQGLSRRLFALLSV